MYSLDINFLKDRAPEQIGTPAKRKSQAITVDSMAFMVGGIVAAGVFLALSVGGLFLVNAQKSSIEKQIAELDAEIQKRTEQKQKVSAIEDQIKKIETDNAALVGVFNQVRPWSAILQDIRDRIPPNVQLNTIEQTEADKKQKTARTPATGKTGQNATPVAEEEPKPELELTITGNAVTYKDLEAFILALKRSDFLNPEKTFIESSKVIENPIVVELSEDAEEAGLIVELPKVVEYTIKTELVDIPASQLIRELDRKGAVGITSRIRILEQKGAIKQ